MEQNPIIQQILSFFPETDQLTLINSYRGVPIMYEASLLKVHDDTIVVKAHKYQSVCMELTKRTFFRNDQIPTIQGRVLRSDIENMTVTLGELTVTDTEIGNRKTIRVSPKDPIPVTIKKKHSRQQIIASLVDISIIGVGVYWISVFMDQVRFFKPNTDVTVSISLPASDNKPWYELTMGASIANIQSLDGIQKFRLGLQITTTSKNQKQIQDYVTVRQNEIIREIRMLYDVLVRLAHQNQR